MVGAPAAAIPGKRTVKGVIANPPSPPVYGEFDDPAPQPDAEIIEVLAAALTNLDIANAEGRHYLTPKERPFVVGREAVGRLQDGTRAWFNAVSLVAPFGSMAPRSLARIGSGLPVPDGVPDALAAAVGNAGLAACLPLSWRARLRPGETVLILGATGVTGSIAVTAAKRLGAGRVIAAGRRTEALQRARALGADAAVSLDLPDLGQTFREAAGGTVDVVIDYLNGAPAEAALDVMATGGRMVQVGSALAPGIHLPAQTARRASLDVLGFAYYHAPRDLQAQAFAELCKLALAGDIRLDYETMPLAEIGDAWDRQKAGSTTRLVLVP